MSASKAKGTRWESAIVTYLTEAGFPGVERRTLAGVQDRGDIAGLPMVIEAKNCRTTTLAAWVDEADTEARNAGVTVGVVWHHRRSKASPADGFVTMSGRGFVTMLLGASSLAHIQAPMSREPSPMTEIEKYAITLLHTGGESTAEDDTDESGRFDSEDDFAEACAMSVAMAHAVRDHAEEFLAWYRQVSG